MSAMDSKQMKTVVRPAHDPERDCLDSWKEIAAYLGRGVRTAQRWEKCESLPVHRHFHAKASSVWAFKHEIDAWLQCRNRAAGESAPNGDHSKRPAESLNPTLLAAAQTPIKSRLLLQEVAAGVGSLDLLQGEGRIRLYFYVQFRAKEDKNGSFKYLVARGGSVN